MTRKRFIKLLMARGYSRNGAALSALLAINNGNTYADAYFAVRLNDGDPDAIDALQEMCNRIDAMISAVAQKFDEVAPTVCEAVQRLRERYESSAE